MRNNGPSFMSRVMRLLVIVVISFAGFKMVTSEGGFDKIESVMNKASEGLGSGVEKIDDLISGGNDSSNIVAGERNYADTNDAALAALANNIVNDYPAKRGYSRESYQTGTKNWNRVSNPNSIGWEDFDNKKCEVRPAVLIEQGNNVVYNTNCDITSGSWTDHYGKRDSKGEITYLTSSNPRDFDIDHVIALSLSWRSGMDVMESDQKNKLANDKANLLISEASINRAKGDASIDSWTPPVESKSYCDYADRYAHVKHKYNLSVTQKEYDKLKEVITSCNS